MSPWIAIAIGGACGALARYSVTLGLQRLAGSGYPWGTLVVNLLGCLLLGMLSQWVISNNSLSDVYQKALGVGFLGAMTTFSTFALETVRLLENQRPGAALANVGMNLIVGLAAVWLGIALVRR